MAQGIWPRGWGMPFQSSIQSPRNAFHSKFRIPNSEFKSLCPLTSEICHLIKAAIYPDSSAAWDPDG